jgi:hypothetical protein
VTKVTGWDNGLSQDYDKGLGRWFANRLGARQQLRQDFESHTMISVALANGGDSTKRRELDFYPTPPEVTHALMQFLEMKGLVCRDSLIWEPACGNGAMSSVLSEYADDVHSTDIRQTGFGIGGSDFLTSQFDCDAVITNPPFVLSEQFITHALCQSPIVAMLLKSQYWHAQKRVELFKKHSPAYVLPLTWRPDFLFDQRENGAKGAPTMEVHWTVWVDGDWDTKYRLLQKPIVKKATP